MEYSKLILAYINTLIWPIAVIAIVLLFRKHIEMLLNRLIGAKLPGGVSLDFGKELTDAKAISRDVIDAKAIGKDIKPSTGAPNRKPKASIPLTEVNARLLNLSLQPSPSGLDLTYYRKLIDSDPTLALAGIRLELEIAAKNLAKGFNVKIGDRHSAGFVMRQLYEKDKITADQFRLAQQIIKLCNAAIHGQIVTDEEAQSVVDVMKVLTDQYIDWLSWGFDDNWQPSNTQVTD